MFESISIQLTPDFSTRDWLELYENTMNGDFTSMDMLNSLFKRKVEPYLHPDIIKGLDEEEQN